MTSEIFGVRGTDVVIVGGTAGIGLAVAKRTVERHGGTIRARNGEGGGAVFEILLPRSQGTAASDRAA